MPLVVEKLSCMCSKSQIVAWVFFFSSFCREQFSSILHVLIGEVLLGTLKEERCLLVLWSGHPGCGRAHLRHRHAAEIELPFSEQGRAACVPGNAGATWVPEPCTTVPADLILSSWHCSGFCCCVVIETVCCKTMTSEEMMIVIQAWEIYSWVVWLADMEWCHVHFREMTLA